MKSDIYLAVFKLLLILSCKAKVSGGYYPFAFCENGLIKIAVTIRYVKICPFI